MHANLGYQPEVSRKFQPNRTAHDWEISIFVRDRLQTTDWQTHESQEAGKTIVRCNREPPGRNGQKVEKVGKEKKEKKKKKREF